MLAGSRQSKFHCKGWVDRVIDRSRSFGAWPHEIADEIAPPALRVANVDPERDARQQQAVRLAHVLRLAAADLLLSDAVTWARASVAGYLWWR